MPIFTIHFWQLVVQFGCCFKLCGAALAVQFPNAFWFAIVCVIFSFNLQVYFWKLSFWNFAIRFANSLVHFHSVDLPFHFAFCFCKFIFCKCGDPMSTGIVGIQVHHNKMFFGMLPHTLHIHVWTFIFFEFCNFKVHFWSILITFETCCWRSILESWQFDLHRHFRTFIL